MLDGESVYKVGQKRRQIGISVSNFEGHYDGIAFHPKLLHYLNAIGIYVALKIKFNLKRAVVR